LYAKPRLFESVAASRGDFVGTVENLALGSCQPRDLPAVGRIHILAGEVCAGEVFIAFGGPQGHDDRLVTCGRLLIGLLCGAANPGCSRLSAGFFAQRAVSFCLLV
jgi:hypothetical protein